MALEKVKSEDSWLVSSGATSYVKIGNLICWRVAGVPKLQALAAAPLPQIRAPGKGVLIYVLKMNSKDARLTDALYWKTFKLDEKHRLLEETILKSAMACKLEKKIGASEKPDGRKNKLDALLTERRELEGKAAEQQIRRVSETS